MQLNSYPQALNTGVDNLLDTHKNEREFAKHLTLGCTLEAYNTRSLSHLISQNLSSFSYLV